jgi:hypothetical protein
MKGLMIDLAKTLFVSFLCTIILFGFALIFKLAVVMDGYRTAEADIAKEISTNE